MLPLEENPFDLHVLSTPPAFVLSQDQTLHRNRVQQLPAESIIFEELVLTRVGKFQLAHEQTELLCLLQVHSIHLALCLRKANRTCF